MLQVETIVKIQKNQSGPGYDILFEDGRSIWVTKARTIPALLILLKYGVGSESDLANGSTTLPTIKKILEGKYPLGLIKDYYGDANKPFSELWNEEGFTWIKQPFGLRKNRSQGYVLDPSDHEKLFLPVNKAFRQSPKITDLANIKQRLPSLCNLCGSQVVPDSQAKGRFSADRLRRRIDHRIPVQKDGKSEDKNYQILCFYCNKSKWQICNPCSKPDCENCALAFPENTTKIFPTGEDIADRMKIL